jgi:hypothetical protein
MRASLRQAGALATLALVLPLAACAGPTGYTKASAFWAVRYGYSDSNIGDDEYSVTVTGNPDTSKERVLDIALLRAAHIAEEQKRSHFVILSKSTQELSRYWPITIPVASGGAIVSLPVGETHRKEPHVVLLIRLLPNDRPPPADALKAADVIAEIAPRLGEETKP